MSTHIFNTIWAEFWSGPGVKKPNKARIFMREKIRVLAYIGAEIAEFILGIWISGFKFEKCDPKLEK